MAHPNEDRLRELYEAFARGDMEAVLAMCDDDIEFHVPGSSPFSGVHTKADFGDWMSQVMELAGGTFREKAYEAVANDDRGVVLLNHSLERDGGEIQYRTCHIWEIRDGVFTRWEEWPGDEQAFDEAWS